MLTLFYAGALALLGLFLAFKSTMTRSASNTMLGTGDSYEMLQITRAHGNLVEYALFFLVLSALLEGSEQVPNIALGILGDLFLLARIAHAYGITRPESVSKFRVAGTVITWLVLAVQSIWALLISISWLIDNNWGF
tara:strand:+ start:376 stop:786 length:411 start_codon:yes stop_codon:yes gene_type:complete